MQLRDRIVRLERIKASEIRPNPQNWRTHPQGQQDALRGILAEVGIAGALLVRESAGGYELIDGHLRADTAPDVEWPCLVLDVDDAEAAKLLATVDPVAAMAEIDSEKLDALLREVDTGSVAVQEMLAELADDAGLYQDEAEIVEDEAPPPPADPVTRAGDLWELGEHRLLCGDSTDAASVARLMDGAKADAVVTDPPYGIAHSGKGITGDAKANDFGAIEGDGSTEVAEQVLATLDWSIPSVVWGANYFPSSVPSGFGWIVWDKMREGETFSGAELAFCNVGVRVDVTRHRWHGMIKDSERGESRVHPTQKPIAVIAFCIRKTGGAVLIYEPFAGSGTTIIAAEQLNRRCYAMEISPQYCDVAALRWMRLTGKPAKCGDKEWTAETMEQLQPALS